jgi:hypothetical protein
MALVHRACTVPPNERRILAGDVLHRLQQGFMQCLERSEVIAARQYQRADDALMQPLRVRQKAFDFSL